MKGMRYAARVARSWTGVLALGLVLAGLAGPVRADTIALQSFAGGVNATSGSDQLYGWLFNVLTPVDVTALGVGDTDSDGLAIAHDVGIYRVSDQALLTSATVPAGTAGQLVTGFRYVGLGSPQLLAPGSYVIVMTMPQLNLDTQSILNTSVGTAPEIVYVDSAFDGSSVLAFPNPANNGAFAQGMFGPNFQFTAAHEVPEPATLTLLGVGGLALAGSRRLRRRS